MPGSKNLQNKQKSTPKMIATRSSPALNSPQTPSDENQQDDLLATIKKIVKEELVRSTRKN